ncbi:hypothetical protein ULMS_05860 [Patiriisocius marinistellae]|uniref:Uncharacterized protein n=1 Tax=Patiriisocius marinistellae TaxID=2494560 RepID=A0A5J4FV52_9FLAO|nr:hypothetical protein [Patiriisocius marinistellae]GEQ85078.1 hypothetical protein ULMS_05860 [Patiriisocius marinistellae]
MDQNLIFQNILHHITVDFNGIVLSSNDTLFKVNLGSNINDFHPIFISSIPQLLSQEEKIMAYPGLNITQNSTQVFCDITIKKEVNFISIIFFNFTSAYISKQQATQSRNEKEIKRQLGNKKS